MNDLPETTGTMGRLVRGAAQHNLCQLYIDKGIALEEGGKGGEAPAAYQKAIAYGNDVIDGSVYSLMTERFGSRADEDPVYYYATEESMQTPEQKVTRTIRRVTKRLFGSPRSTMMPIKRRMENQNYSIPVLLVRFIEILCLLI